MHPITIRFREHVSLSIPPESLRVGGDMDPFVAAIWPGKGPAIMTESECYEKLKCFRNYKPVYTIHTPDTRADGLNVFFHPDLKLDLGDHLYICGPVVIYGTEQVGNHISLDSGQIQDAIAFFRRNRVTLCADALVLPVFKLWQPETGKEDNNEFASL